MADHADTAQELDAIAARLPAIATLTEKDLEAEYIALLGRKQGRLTEFLKTVLPALPAEAMYDVYVAVPACGARKPNTASARYLVRYRDGTQEIVVDQQANAGKWVLLGRFPFRAGDGGAVELRDVAGDGMRALWFDAVKWVVAS